MSKSRVESKGFNESDGRGKEIIDIDIACRGGRDVWELRWDVGGVRSGLTNAASPLCISDSTSMA